jgi:hypothetical protein
MTTLMAETVQYWRSGVGRVWRCLLHCQRTGSRRGQSRVLWGSYRLRMSCSSRIRLPRHALRP